MKTNLTEPKDKWLECIRRVVDEIRHWPVWKEDPLKLMRSKSGGFAAGALTLYAYSHYVQRFTLIMCAVLAKAPKADQRFWRLAVNLYDELGGADGFKAAHGKLIEDAAIRPNGILQEEWNNVIVALDSIEKELVEEFTSLPWPLNLFALGPGTESISDLFLDPIEIWSSDALANLPRLKSYFDAHRPEIELEHQMAITSILAEELNTLPQETAESLFSEGKQIAERAAMRHYKATCLCWRVSKSKALAQHDAS